MEKCVSAGMSIWKNVFQPGCLYGRMCFSRDFFFSRFNTQQTMKAAQDKFRAANSVRNSEVNFQI